MASNEPVAPGEAPFTFQAQRVELGSEVPASTVPPRIAAISSGLSNEHGAGSVAAIRMTPARSCFTLGAFKLTPAVSKTTQRQVEANNAFMIRSPLGQDCNRFYGLGKLYFNQQIHLRLHRRVCPTYPVFGLRNWLKVWMGGSCPPVEKLKFQRRRDHMMCNCPRVRSVNAFRVFACQHQPHFVKGKPARRFQFLIIE